MSDHYILNVNLKYQIELKVVDDQGNFKRLVKTFNCPDVSTIWMELLGCEEWEDENDE